MPWPQNHQKWIPWPQKPIYNKWQADTWIWPWIVLIYKSKMAAKPVYIGPIASKPSAMDSLTPKTYIKQTTGLYIAFEASFWIVEINARIWGNRSKANDLENEVKVTKSFSTLETTMSHLWPKFEGDWSSSVVRRLFTRKSGNRQLTTLKMKSRSPKVFQLKKTPWATSDPNLKVIDQILWPGGCEQGEADADDDDADICKTKCLLPSSRGET